MSYELINRITIKKDGVYVSSHSNNDTSSYISHRIPFLTEAYNSGGRRELDRVILGMLYSNWELRGNHKSLERYRYVLNHPTAIREYRNYVDAEEELYDLLVQHGKENDIYKEKVKELTEKKNKLYSLLADLCSEYESEEK